MAHHPSVSATSYPSDDQLNFISAPDAPLESDAEEDEVDQLDSDSDTTETDDNRQNGTNLGGQRVLGRTLLPSMRIENIIQAEGVTGNLALSKEGIFVLSIATEEFIKRMAQAGQLRASAEGRTSVNYSDMAATTQQYQEFMFLADTIPAPIPLSEALLMREAKEREMLEEDPAITPSANPSISVSVSAPQLHKQKTKNRNTANGQSSSNASEQNQKADNHSISENYAPGEHDSETSHSMWVQPRPSHSGPTRSISVQNGRLSLSARPSPLINGHSAAPSSTGTLTPPQSQDTSGNVSPRSHPPFTAAPPAVAQAQSEEQQPWPGQYTGPASGFLQGPGGPFGHVSQNPGRTIYSQHRAE